MRAMLLKQTVNLDRYSEPLELAELPVPEPAATEVLIKIIACGVCHTELDEIEGRTAPPSFPVIPGHEIVGIVAAAGKAVTLLKEGERVGVGWIYHSSGGALENIDNAFRATGRDVNGGYAEYMVIDEKYACPIPEVFSDTQAAPLLCAGAIGFRALRLCNLKDGDLLGLTGFGGSAHLVLQLVHHLYPNTGVFVFARDQQSRDFAAQLGADWTGDTPDVCPQALNAIIDTTPAWLPVREALMNLCPGGRLVINAIRKEDTDKSCLLELNYHDHLWMEKEIKSVANITMDDIREFLHVAAQIPIIPEISCYPLEDANRALLDLKFGTVKGAKVLTI